MAGAREQRPCARCLELEAEVERLRDKLDLYMIFARLQTDKLAEVLARPKAGRPPTIGTVKKRQMRARRKKTREGKRRDDSIFGAQALAAHNLHIAKKGRQ